ncbi:inhibitor of vertebrate lysozyme family protein [Pseudomonas sp. BMS12]|uniref:inhibitor of vertebrate lysozyme family protein n=1 Tax=Pseudomonas sp. BMS12 TaxID=1796033 RepID=UPI00083A7769|nr:inhibitor of vertebrate lysozyme family protein [Pseudomonas sp. BMS12]
MSPWKNLLGAAWLTLACTAQAATSGAEMRVEQILQSDPQYQDAWQEVLEDEERLPDWVINLDGMGQPMEAQESEGEQYLVGRLCEAYDCFHQRLFVAFSWDKQQAYALLVQLPQGLPADRAPAEHDRQRWLGEPDEDMRKLLLEQLASEPDWY